MKIEKLHVYGFGFLQDVVIDFEQPFHIIYGKNEAGKSTILAFIETMLFGFPKRQQQYDYAPKSGGVYGGKLIATFQHAGSLVIERVKNREPEETLIYFNEKKIDETELHFLLERVDRSLFQQLFSTRLDHLREMERLDEQALNRFLLGASVSGHLSLHTIEADLEEKQVQLFRPQGRKPVLNVMASQLQELAETVKKSERLREAYEHLKQEKTGIENQLIELQTERKQWQTKRSFYEVLKDAAPLYERLEVYKQQLNEMPENLHIPEHGVDRLKELQTKIVDLKAEQRSLEQRIEKLKQSVPNVNAEWLKLTDAIDLLRERSESYQMKLERLFHVTEQIKHVNREIQQFLDQAGSNWSYELLADADVSLAKAETIERFTTEIKKISDEYSELEKEFALVQNRLKAAERKAAEIEKTLLPHDERQELQFLLDTYDHTRVQHEKEFSERMLKRYDSEMKELQRARNFSFLVSAVFAAMMLIALFLFRTDWKFTLSLLSGFAGLSSILFLTDRNRRKKRERLRQLQNEEKQKLSELENVRHNFNEIESAKQKWLIDEERRKEWLLIKHQVDELQAEFNELANDYDALKVKKHEILKNAKQWAKDNHIPETVPISHWTAWFQNLKEAKKQAQTLQNLELEKAAIERWIQDYEHHVYELCDCFSLSKKDNVTSLLLKLQRLLEEEKAKQMQAENIQRQIIEEQKRFDDCIEKMKHYEKELHQLLNEANCESEEQFIALAKQFAEKQKLIEEINRFQFQIRLICRDEKMKQKIEEKLKAENLQAEEKLAEIEMRLEEIEKEQTLLFERKTKLAVEMKAIEEGGEYDEYLQKLEFQKAQFRNSAFEWGVYAIALHVLQKTKERFRKERLPEVVRTATQYFSQMTKDAYQSIMVPIDGETFYVESRDGVRFRPHELSRGTQEQLYLSLRFALISAYPSSFRFPILLDDIFVHFDKERKKQAFLLLHQLAQKHQIILFTCHEEVAELSGGTIISM